MMAQDERIRELMLMNLGVDSYIDATPAYS